MEQPVNAPTGVREYTLIEQYVCPISRICVQKGFTYDGASVPRVCWSLFGMLPDGLNRAAALVHDWCYRNGGLVVNNCGDELTITRKGADKLFRDLLLKAGASKFKTALAFYAVRLFGRSGYKGD